LRRIEEEFSVIWISSVAMTAFSQTRSPSICSIRARVSDSMSFTMQAVR